MRAHGGSHGGALHDAPAWTASGVQPQNTTPGRSQHLGTILAHSMDPSAALHAVGGPAGDDSSEEASCSPPSPPLGPPRRILGFQRSSSSSEGWAEAPRARMCSWTERQSAQGALDQLLREQRQAELRPLGAARLTINTSRSLQAPPRHAGGGGDVRRTELPPGGTALEESSPHTVVPSPSAAAPQAPPLSQWGGPAAPSAGKKSPLLPPVKAGGGGGGGGAPGGGMTRACSGTIGVPR